MRWIGWGFGAAVGLTLLACGAGEGSSGLRSDAAGREPDALPPELDTGHEPERQWAALAGGCFSMGSPETPGAQPVHEVCLEAFELAKAEITNAEYQTCVDAGACDPPHYDDATCWIFETDDWTQAVADPAVRDGANPVVCVDWTQARAYAAFAGGRLPTEAEWEYAAQSGGQGSVYPWGDAYPDCLRAVMTHRNLPCESEHTAPPCSRPEGRTQQGACDLAGNVWEWVEDAWRADYTGAPADGAAVIDEGVDQRVVRGGGWQVNNADYLRTRYRDDEPATITYDFLGFRLVR